MVNIDNIYKVKINIEHFIAYFFYLYLLEKPVCSRMMAFWEKENVFDPYSTCKLECTVVLALQHFDL